MDDAYVKTLEMARTELEGLVAEESQLESRLDANRTRQNGLRKTIDSLSLLTGNDIEEAASGITEAILGVLNKHYETSKKTGLHPVAIRDRIQQAGFDISIYKNPMAVIHTTLKRLQDQGDVEFIEGKDKKVAYQISDVPF